MRLPLKSKVLFDLVALVAIAFLPGLVWADGDRCPICGGELSGTIYLITDKVTNEKKQICQNCSTLTETCFVCGLPVKTDYTELPDGRFRISLRSKGEMNVASVAERLGGGGHQCASGCSVDGPLSAAVERVLTQLRQQPSAK